MKNDFNSKFPIAPTLVDRVTSLKVYVLPVLKILRKVDLQYFLKLFFLPLKIDGNLQWNEHMEIIAVISPHPLKAVVQVGYYPTLLFGP